MSTQSEAARLAPHLGQLVQAGEKLMRLVEIYATGHVGCIPEEDIYEEGEQGGRYKLENLKEFLAEEVGIAFPLECECGDPSCNRHLPISPDEYNWIKEMGANIYVRHPECTYVHPKEELEPDVWLFGVRIIRNSSEDGIAWLP